MELFVHHHLGLGDHIICNGLIRTLVENYDKIYVFAKKTNAPRVSRMFEDDPRISIISLESFKNFTDEYTLINAIIAEKNIKNYLQLGFSGMYRFPYLNFDEVFYKQANVPFDNRWSMFKIKRNINSEENVYNRLNPKNKPYMFVHDDSNRGYVVNPPNPKGLEVIRNDISVDIFDMCKILENASEIHCMESSFRCLIEGLPLITCPLYLHKQIRFAGETNPALSIGRKHWIEI